MVLVSLQVEVVGSQRRGFLLMVNISVTGLVSWKSYEDKSCMLIDTIWLIDKLIQSNNIHWAQYILFFFLDNC